MTEHTAREDLNMAKFPLERHKQNKVYSTSRSKQSEDYVGRNGPEGIELVSAMMWAESSGRNTGVTDSIVEQRHGRTHRSGDTIRYSCLRATGQTAQIFMDFHGFSLRFS